MKFSRCLGVRRIVVGAIAVCVTCLAACGPSTAPLTLELRAADTHAPIGGAAVAVDSLALGPSLAAPDIVDELMGRRVAFTDRATTDASGVARLDHIADRALRVTIITQGVAPMFALLEQSLGDTPTPWVPMATSPMVEYRVAVPEIRAERRKPPGGAR